MPSVNFFCGWLLRPIDFHGNLVDANHGIGCSMADHFLISSHHQKFGQLLRKLGVTRASMAFEIKSRASWRRSWVDLGMSRLSSDNDIFKFIVCYPLDDRMLSWSILIAFHLHILWTAVSNWFPDVARRFWGVAMAQPVASPWSSKRPNTSGLAGDVFLGWNLGLWMALKRAVGAYMGIPSCWL